MQQQPSKKPLNFADEAMRWNNLYPFDYQWRKKYNIPFGSSAHNEASHIDMAMDLAGDYIINKMIEKHEKEKDDTEFEDMLPTVKGIFSGPLDHLKRIIAGESGAVQQEELKVVKMTKAEIDDDFKNLDLSEYDEPQIES